MKTTKNSRHSVNFRHGAMHSPFGNFSFTLRYGHRHLQGASPKERMRGSEFVKSPGLGGWTMVEVLVVVAILGILGSLAFPMNRRIQERAKAASCVEGIRQAGTNLFLERVKENAATDEEEEEWVTLPCGCQVAVRPSSDKKTRFALVGECPRAPANPLYDINPQEEPKTLSFGVLDPEIAKRLPPRQQWLLACSDNGLITTVKDLAFDRHLHDVNVFFADGSVRAMTSEEIPFP